MLLVIAEPVTAMSLARAVMVTVPPAMVEPTTALSWVAVVLFDLETPSEAETPAVLVSALVTAATLRSVSEAAVMAVAAAPPLAPAPTRSVSVATDFTAALTFS